MCKQLGGCVCVYVCARERMHSPVGFLIVIFFYNYSVVAYPFPTNADTSGRARSSRNGV